MAGEPTAAPDQPAVSAPDDQSGAATGTLGDPHALPAQVVGNTGTADDRFAATVVSSVERFWRSEFPARFRLPWRNIHGFTEADPRDPVAPIPCLRHPEDLANQALYCPRLDTVVWDRGQLIPELRDHYGDGAVLVALSHEIGHAVQERLGFDAAAQERDPDRYPMILMEGMADCFAGVTLRAVSQGRIPTLHTSPDDLNEALRSLLAFRDPVGASPQGGAHGNAFDRASAFIRGYDSGAQECAGMSVEKTTFTERTFSSEAEEASAGNLPLPALLDTAGPNVASWFETLAAKRGQGSTSARLISGIRCPAESSQRRPARLCLPDLGVPTSHGQLADAYRRYGDYATTTVLASRYALATLATLDRPVVGPEAGRAAVCLAGAYTRDLFARGTGSFGLSPGDLDEAVDELLNQDTAARDADGDAPDGDLGFDRIHQFRAGMIDGPAGCGL